MVVVCPPTAESSFSKSGYVVLTFILLVLSLGAAFWCWRINNEKVAEAGETWDVLRKL